MSTISIAVDPDDASVIYQGDIFNNLKYNYISSEDDELAYVDEYNFLYSIIISQSCDTTAMAAMQNAKKGKINKFMPAILLCPLYPYDSGDFKNDISEVINKMEIQDITETNDRIASKTDRDIAKSDLHYRFHKLTVRYGGVDVMTDYIIDFKHCYSLPMKYLLEKKENRVFHLDGIYAEQITLKFANYISRVAMPNISGVDRL